MSRPETILRLGIEADILAIAELEKACFPDPWSPKALRGTLREEGGFFLVAEQEESLLGYLNASFLFDECNLNRICVLTDSRKMGIAAGMMAEMIARCKQMNTARVVLEVRKSNLAAQELYARFGFVLLGERANFYEHPTESGLIMELLL